MIEKIKDNLKNLNTANAVSITVNLPWNNRKLYRRKTGRNIKRNI